MTMTTSQKLAKTRKTISNHAARGNMINNRRSLELIDKYTELKDSLTWLQWKIYCEHYNLDTAHDAYDLFA